MITIEMRRDSRDENHLWAMYDEARMELIFHAARENLLEATLTGTGAEAALTVTVSLDEPETPRQDGILTPGWGRAGYPASERVELFLHELQEKGLLASGGRAGLHFEAETDEEAELIDRLTSQLRNSYSPPTAEQKPRYCVATVRLAVPLGTKNPDCHYDDERWAEEAIEAELDGLDLTADHEFVSRPRLSALPARGGRHECCGSDESPF